MCRVLIALSAIFVTEAIIADDTMSQGHIDAMEDKVEDLETDYIPALEGSIINAWAAIIAVEQVKGYLSQEVPRWHVSEAERLLGSCRTFTEAARFDIDMCQQFYTYYLQTNDWAWYVEAERMYWFCQMNTDDPYNQWVHDDIFVPDDATEARTACALRLGYVYATLD